MTATDHQLDGGDVDDGPASLSLLRCGSCGRRWLEAGDLRDGGPFPCPHCADGSAGVLGVHH
jgi:hypothetical protein